MTKNLAQDAGKEAVEKLGWWQAHRFLIVRRLCQLTIIALFILVPHGAFCKVTCLRVCCLIQCR